MDESDLEFFKSFREQLVSSIQIVKDPFCILVP